VECLGHDLQKDYRAFEDALALADEKKILLDGVLAQSEREVESLMRIREDTQVLRESFVSTQHFDISLPIDVMDKEVERIVADLEQLPFIDAVLAFGHIADGNLHLVVGKNETSPVISKTIESTIYKNLKKYLGSVSAEHGIGVHKKAHLKTSKSPEEIALMKTLKQAVDPKNLLNPGRIF
jgi:FAD/FMN-containing dehydrogenase